MRPETISFIMDKAKEFEEKGEFDKAFALYSKASESGNRESSLKVGRMLIEGKGCMRQPIKGFSIIDKINVESDPRSKFELGRCHFEGSGTEKNEELGFQMMAESAESGYAPAESFIGKLYIDGNYVDKDPRRGMDWARRSADQGDPDGLFLLSRDYNEELVHDYDCKKWMELLEKATSMGNGEAEYEIGHHYYSSRKHRDYAKATEYFSRSLRHGFNKSGVYLGLIYRDGLSTDRNLEMARKCFTKAAVNGISDGMFYLAGLYDVKDWLPNHHRAFIWLKRGYEKGNERCINHLADKYRKGEGVKTNKKRAFELYLESASKGSVYGMECVGRCYEEGMGTVSNYDKATEWYLAAISEGSGLACERIGIMIRDGKGCRPSDTMAIESLKMAVKYGNYDATAPLGEIYEKEGENHSMAEAIYWYKIGVENEVPEAMLRLAEHYDSGVFIEPSYEKAFDLYNRSMRISESGEAAANIGRYYEEGLYVEKDLEKAKEWYTRAAKMRNAFAMNRLFHIISMSDDPLKRKGAMFWLMRSAARGNAESMLELGDRYHEGKDVPKSGYGAMHWYHEASEKGKDEAKHKFESIVFEEDDRDPLYDGKEAKMERSAGEDMDDRAVEDLAELFMYGDNEYKADRDKARLWYSIMEVLGMPDAKKRIAEIDAMTNKGRSKDEVTKENPPKE